MKGLISYLGTLFQSLFAYLLDVATWCLDGVVYVIKSAFYFVFDQLLTFAETIISALDFSALTSHFSVGWSYLPPQLIYLVGAIGLHEGFAIIGTAYAIRLTLNLIPSTLTRV